MRTLEIPRGDLERGGILWPRKALEERLRAEGFDIEASRDAVSRYDASTDASMTVSGKPITKKLDDTGKRWIFAQGE